MTRVQLEHISAVTGTDVEDYLEQALASGEKFGYLGQYRFHLCEQSGGWLLIFLDCSNQLRSVRNVILISLAGSLLILAGTGFLVFLLSKRAIQPMVNSAARQKQFVTDASHELRTPLTAILAACDLMIMDDPENEWLGTVRHEASRMSALVTQLVSLARLDEEDPYPEQRLFSISRTAWDIVPTFQAMAKSKNHPFEVKIQEQLWMYGEETAIQRVISILLDNAVKYAQEGGTIFSSLYRDRRSICFETRNPCPPIVGGDLPRLFDRFYRADPSRTRSTGGSGIGLSMAKAIVEAHGGKISVQYRNDTICFRVRLRPAPEGQTGRRPHRGAGLFSSRSRHF